LGGCGALVELGGTDCMVMIVPVTGAVGKKVSGCFVFARQ